MGTGIALLHKQEGADALNFALETAVSQSFALRAQPACSHPLSVLLLLGWEDRNEVGDRCQYLRKLQTNKGDGEEAL